MTPAQYLDAAKERIQVSSDYELARRLGMPKQHISAWRSGKRSPDAYACAVLAITLELDPATVIADVQQQAETHAGRKEFWRSFLSRAGKVAAVLCTLASLAFAGFGSVQAGSGGGFRRRALAA